MRRMGASRSPASRSASRRRPRAIGRWYDVYAFRIGRPEERRIAVLFNDVTAARTASAERDRLLRALEVERSRLEYVFEQAPAFLAVLRGPEHVFELANDAYYRLVGKRELIGKPLREAIPEVVDQGFENLLNQVLATGTPYVGREVPVRISRTPGARVRGALPGPRVSPPRRGRRRARRRHRARHRRQRAGARAARGRAALRSRAARAHRGGGGVPARRSGQPRQEPVPRGDVPRAAHAAERHRRLRGAAGDGDPRPRHGRAARGPEPHPDEPAAPARPHQRGAQLREARDGDGAVRHRRRAGAVGARRGRVARRAAGARQGAHAASRRSARRTSPRARTPRSCGRSSSTCSRTR